MLSLEYIIAAFKATTMYKLTQALTPATAHIASPLLYRSERFVAVVVFERVLRGVLSASGALVPLCEGACVAGDADRVGDTPGTMDGGTDGVGKGVQDGIGLIVEEGVPPGTVGVPVPVRSGVRVRDSVGILAGVAVIEVEADLDDDPVLEAVRNADAVFEPVADGVGDWVHVGVTELDGELDAEDEGDALSELEGEEGALLEGADEAEPSGVGSGDPAVVFDGDAVPDCVRVTTAVPVFVDVTAGEPVSEPDAELVGVFEALIVAVGVAEGVLGGVSVTLLESVLLSDAVADAVAVPVAVEVTVFETVTVGVAGGVAVPEEVSDFESVAVGVLLAVPVCVPVDVFVCV